MQHKLCFWLSIGQLLLLLGGCGGILGSLEQKRNLANAVDMIQSGRDNEARRFLNLVINAPWEDGVTDEALFRLSLLQLNKAEPGEGKSSAALLDRLHSSSPKSVWMRQAAPLQEYLLGVKDSRNRLRELNSLREKNLTLSKDVHDLRQIIERLKTLDVELEQKIRR